MTVDLKTPITMKDLMPGLNYLIGAEWRIDPNLTEDYLANKINDLLLRLNVDQELSGKIEQNVRHFVREFRKGNFKIDWLHPPI